MYINICTHIYIYTYISYTHENTKILHDKVVRRVQGPALKSKYLIRQLHRSVALLPAFPPWHCAKDGQAAFVG